MSESHMRVDLECEVILRKARGLHLRPSQQLASLCRGFDVCVVFWKGNQQAKATSLTSLLALEAKQGDELRVCVSGPEAAEAMRAIVQVLEAPCTHVE